MSATCYLCGKGPRWRYPGGDAEFGPAERLCACPDYYPDPTEPGCGDACDCGSCQLARAQEAAWPETNGVNPAELAWYETPEGQAYIAAMDAEYEREHAWESLVVPPSSPLPPAPLPRP